MSQAPALRPIDYKCGRPVFLSVDTSIHGIGFVLSQTDETGRRVPARYGSLPITDVASRYGQSRLELYGLFRALRHFRIHLVGVPKLIVEVDASSIKGMLNNPDIQASAPLNRWIRGILMYDFELVHVPGHRHKAPDALSRRRYTTADEALGLDSEDSTDEDIGNPPPPYTPTDEGPFRVGVARHRDKEQEIWDILHFLRTFRPPATTSTRERQRFLSIAARYYYEEGRLYRRHVSGHNQRVVMTATRRNQILAELHDGVGHRGEWALWEAVRIRFYWPGIRKDVTQYVKSCHTCQLRSTKKMHIPITVSNPAALFSKVYLDVMKMPEAQGKKWIVTCRDDLSGTTEGRALASDNARAVASFFIEQIIFRYGTVEVVITDNGPSLGGEFARLVNKYNIHQIRISPYNSQANGVVERSHYVLREALVKMCGNDIQKWPSLLPAALYADRITVRRATGYSPYYLLHGVHPLLPCDLAETTFMIPQLDSPITDTELLAARIRQIAKMPEDVTRAKNILRQSRFKSKEAFEAQFGQRIQRTSFRPGELVLIRNNVLEKTVSISRKVKNRYMGPYRVVRENQGRAYVLEELNGSVLATPVAAFRLIPYVRREQLDGWARLVENWDQHQAETPNHSQDETGTEEGDDANNDM